MDLSVTAVCLTLLLAWRSSLASVQVVDLTHNFGPNTVYWPGNPSFNFTILYRGNNSQGGFWYESNSFFTSEHGGTHVDAPAHFSEGGWRVEDIPVSNLVGPAVVVDVKAKAAADADYLMTIQDLEDWEKAHGPIPARCIVLMNSGWDRRYPNATWIFNSPTPSDPSTFHFPGIHPDAAAFLATQRDVIAVGVDTPSLDNGPSTTFRSHVNLLGHNVFGLENVAGLDQLPAEGSAVIVGVVKLVDGSGGPVRLIGLVGQGATDIFSPDTGSGHRPARAGALKVFWMVGVAVGLGW